MDNAQLRYIFDRQKQANNEAKKGLLQIEVRLTGSNKRKLISTGIHLYKNQFSEKNGFEDDPYNDIFLKGLYLHHSRI